MLSIDELDIKGTLRRKKRASRTRKIVWFIVLLTFIMISVTSKAADPQFLIILGSLVGTVVGYIIWKLDLINIQLKLSTYLIQDLKNQINCIAKDIVPKNPRSLENEILEKYLRAEKDELTLLEEFVWNLYREASKECFLHLLLALVRDKDVSFEFAKISSYQVLRITDKDAVHITIFEPVLNIIAELDEEVRDFLENAGAISEPLESMKMYQLNFGDWFWKADLIGAFKEVLVDNSGQNKVLIDGFDIDEEVYSSYGD